MMDTTLYRQIRQCITQGMSERATAQYLSISRKTVHRYGRGEYIPGETGSRARNQSRKAEEITAWLDDYFAAHQDAPKKQQPTARTAWRELVSLGYQIGESTVRQYVQEIKQQLPEIFVPLSYEPAEAMEVDWCQNEVYVAGKKIKVHTFCAVLAYSNACFVAVYPNEQFPSFVSGHVEAFEYFGGVPNSKVIYDNLKTAVLEGFGRKAVTQERFDLLSAHYNYQPVFCNRAKGNEKSAAENLCKNCRNVVFRPVPRVSDFGELMRLVESRYIEYNMNHRLKSRKETVRALYEQERTHLLPLPARPFDVYESRAVKVHKDLTFTYNSTRYSLPERYAGQEIALKIFPFKIECYHKGSLIYTHARPAERGDHQYIPDHYLPILEKKSRAIENAAPLKFGILPPELAEFRARCKDPNRLEQLCKILILARTQDHETLMRVVRVVSKRPRPTYDGVVALLKIQQDALIAVESQREAPARDMTAYDSLLGGYDEHQ
jgi:transposase